MNAARKKCLTGKAGTPLRQGKRTVMTTETFTEAMENAEAVHEVLEDLTPPEALEILTMVSKNLKAEIRDMQ